MPAKPTKPLISIDGQFADWVASELIGYRDVPGCSFYAQAQNDKYRFSLAAPIVVGANTTFWFNTDRKAATGYQNALFRTAPFCIAQRGWLTPKRYSNRRREVLA